MASIDSIESSLPSSVSKLKGKIWKEKSRFLPQTSGTSETKWEKFEMAEIQVSSPFPQVDGAPQSVSIGETITTILSIENSSSTNYARLVAVKIDSSEPKGSFTLCYRGPSSSSSASSQPVKSEVISFLGNTGSMEPGRRIMLDLSFTPKRPGLSTVTIVVDIGDKEIVRSATLLTSGYTRQQKQDYDFPVPDQLKGSSSGYTPQQKQEYNFPVPDHLKESSRADRPQRKQDYDFPVPDHLKESYRMKRIPGILLKGLSEETYCDYFSTLLYLEDLHLKEMSEQSVMVKMRNDKDSQLLVVLKLQGRGQKNSGRRSPSTLDYVRVKDPQKKRKEYKGCINKVDKKKVFVRFEKRIYVNPKIEYEAWFSYNRSNIIRGHHAIAKIKDLSNSFLFPMESPSTTVQACTDHGEADIGLEVPFNPLLNSDQLSAIMGILKCNGSPPYLVYGKPRTGTTATITEAILQIHENYPNARILACTPFNRTSDSLLKRFIGSPIQDTEIFRLNAKFRDLYDEVPPEIYPYCCYSKKEEIYYCPPLEQLREYKLIVSTYMSAARLHDSGLHVGHFTHIFLDTAGQASEPETMVPIANFATEQTVVVVSGNLGELAHEISCPMARKFGLSKSYLKRFTELPFYSLRYGKENQAFVTKLEKEFDDPLSDEDRRKGRRLKGVWNA